MGLAETFESLRPSIIAFINRVTVHALAERPVFPHIVGTGFFVHRNGIVATNRHVIAALDKIHEEYPRHPKTHASAAAALVFTELRASTKGLGLGMLNIDVIGWQALDEFSATGVRWYGEDVPDLGFVQLKARDVPTVPLVEEANVLRAGISIATAGFPEGSDTVTYFNKITQLTPVLRHGIISSVFPFGGPQPHGFSIDTLLQGGASGSPVFLPEKPAAVGMIASKIPDTNYSVAVPSHIIASALSAVLKQWPEFPNLPPLRDLTDAGEAAGRSELSWDEVTPPPEPNAEA